MGIRRTSQADVKGYPRFSGDGSADSAQVKGKKGHQQRVFSIQFRAIGNPGYAINQLLKAYLGEDPIVGRQFGEATRE